MTTPLQLNGDDYRDNHDLVVHTEQPLRMRYGNNPVASAPPPAETDDLAFVMQYVRLMWRHKWVLVLSLLLGAGIGVARSLRAVPMYMASTTLEIQNVQEPFSATPSAASTDPTLSTQVQLLSSISMRQRAQNKLNAKTDVPKPEVYLPLDPLRKVLGLADPLSKPDSWPIAVIEASAVTVTITKDSRILQIQSTSRHPQAAADFANTLAEEYIARGQEERWESYESTGEWLTKAQSQLKEKLEESDRKLADFAKSKGLIFTGGSQNISEDKLKQLQGALLSASAERIQKQSIYESSLSKDNTESLPAVLDSGPMGGYTSKISDLRRELAELSTTLTPAHYRIQRLQAQIDELEATRQRERTNIISRIKIDYEAALKRETQLRHDFEAQSGVLAGQSDDLITYNILQREVEGNKKLYEATLQQGKEASLASAMKTTGARIVDAARVSRAPFYPSVQYNLTLCMLGTLICGVVFVVVRSRSDLSIQLPGVLGTHLNLRELGVIPSAKADPTIKSLSASFRAALGPGKPSAVRRGKTMLADAGNDSADCLELVTWNRKPSVMAEAFRSTMTSIMFSGENGDRPRVLVVTSPSPQEGKSTVITNLAVALAEINHRVLIIDADMRLPRLHDIFDVPNTFGLSDILHERTPIQDYADESLVRKTAIPDLWVLPAGPARTNLSRLLYSTRMKELIRRFRHSFDTILIDSPPVLAVPDARILARSADAVILVVRAHRTQPEAAFAAVKCFEEDGRRILGTILNDWNPKSTPYGGAYGGAYASYGAYNSQYFNEDRS